MCMEVCGGVMGEVLGECVRMWGSVGGGGCEVCWDVGKVRGDVGGVGKCDGVWGRCGVCMEVCGGVWDGRSVGGVC